MTVGVRLSTPSLKVLQEVSNRTGNSIAKLVREIVDLGLDYVIDKYEGIDNSACMTKKNVMHRTAIDLDLDLVGKLNILSESLNVRRHLIVAKCIEKSVDYIKGKYSNYTDKIPRKTITHNSNVRVRITIPLEFSLILEELAEKLNTYKPYFIRECIIRSIDSISEDDFR